MLAICSAPRHVILHPVKSMFRILVEYLTLWQMTEINKKKVSKHQTFDSIGKFAFVVVKIYILSKPSSEMGQLARERFSKDTLFAKP